MGEYTKPLPNITPLNKEFWEGLRRHELVLQRCRECRTAIFYARSMCTNCMSENLEWFTAAGRGNIYTFTVVHQPPIETFSADVPYVVALVKLDEGPTLMTNIVGCNPEEVCIDMQVEAIFERANEEVTILRFKPATRGASGRPSATRLP